MKNILFLLIALVFTSCIEIIQEIQLKKNGSGTAIYTMNMSKIQDLMESLKSLGGESKDTDLGNIDKQFANYVENLKRMEGISKVKLSSKNFVYKISFQFKNVSSLNKALTYLNNGKGGLGQETIEYVKIDKKQIIVKNSNPMAKLNEKSKSQKGDDTNEEQEMGDTIVEENKVDSLFKEEDMMKTFFMDASYTTIVQVYGNISSNSHPNAQVSGKKVTLKIPLLELDKAENVQNIITLK